MTERRGWLRSAIPVRLRTGTAILVTAALALAPIALGAAVLPADAYATKWQSGVSTGKCGPEPVQAFSKWRGSKVERTSGYVQDDSWTVLTTLKGLGTCVKRAGVPVTLSVPMLPKNAGTITNGAKGKYNAYWTKFGKAAIANGYSHATLRIGWEMNGNWFKWSATKDPTHWKQYWIQIIKTLRKVPGQHFTYEWAVGLGKHSNFDPRKAYPGNSYVTYIGSSVYDQKWGTYGASGATIWKGLSTGAFGLNWLASYAKSKHKKIGISEWALASRASFSHSGGGDDVYFITHFYAWAKKSNVAYEIYFNRVHKGTTTNEHRLAKGTTTLTTNSAFPKAAKAYKKYFG
jgi:hypothetical protein